MIISHIKTKLLTFLGYYYVIIYYTDITLYIMAHDYLYDWYKQLIWDF